MARYLGIDTSNYRTSAALFDPETGDWRNEGRLLEVPQGQIGLRQSDALFQHVVHLPERLEALLPEEGISLAGIGVSTRPRAVEGSYMPCFLAGEGTARALAKSHGVPLYRVSHQQGHLAAAALSAGKLSLLKEPFYAWHLSGGTTELLRVRPEGTLFAAEIVGGTTDLAAGQVIDRAGCLLGLPFPAGAVLEPLSRANTQSVAPWSPAVKDCTFSLSGAQNKIEALYHSGASREAVAWYTMDIIKRAIVKATAQAVQRERLPVLCAGGVMANRGLQAEMKQRFGAYFAEPVLSGDNAVGVAVLAAMQNGAL